jgi:glycosyltransferase involved in cell wall biosynthesis
LKNILYISPSIHVKGGISSVIKGYLASDLSRQYNMYFVASHVDGPKWVKLIKAIIGLIETIFYLIHKEIDIVHIHGGDTLSFKRKCFYIKIVQLFSCKIIYHHHGAAFMHEYEFLSKKWKKLVKKTFEEIDLIIVLSNSWRDNIQQIAPKTNITVIPNSIKLPRLQEKQISNPLQLTFLGLIGDRKGVFDLLKVFKKLINNGYPVRLNIGGNGEITRLFKELRKLGIADYVKYCGWIQDKEKDLLLRKTDIFVLPSYAEGMPMSILEAMSYAIPVVTTNVGGIPELVIEGKTGYLIDPGDLDALYKKISFLIQNKDIRRDFGNKGRLLIKNKYNIDVNFQKLSRIYNSFSHEG